MFVESYRDPLPPRKHIPRRASEGSRFDVVIIASMNVVVALYLVFLWSCLR
jgi:hypothetical protein